MRWARVGSSPSVPHPRDGKSLPVWRVRWAGETRPFGTFRAGVRTAALDGARPTLPASVRRRSPAKSPRPAFAPSRPRRRPRRGASSPSFAAPFLRRAVGRSGTASGSEHRNAPSHASRSVDDLRRRIAGRSRPRFGGGRIGSDHLPGGIRGITLDTSFRGWLVRIASADNVFVGLHAHPGRDATTLCLTGLLDRVESRAFSSQVVFMLCRSWRYHRCLFFRTCP